jgi:putative ABC transport system permease protein
MTSASREFKAVTTFREWISRLVGTLRPRRADADLEEELRAHLELATESQQKHHASLAEARRAALVRLGGPAQALDALRDQRGLPRLLDTLQDLRHASRSLRKAPGFALMAVITLGSGLGATATVFTAVDALIVRPLAVEKPRELYVVRRAGEPRARFPIEFHRALHESGTVFADSVASSTFPVTLFADDMGSRARAAIVTSNYFEVLGVRPILGRFFSADEGRDVVVISHRLWRERFGGRPSTVGEVVRVGGSTFVIAGIAPPGFGGLQLDIALDLWVPLSALPKAVPIPSLRPRVDIVGRLTDGLSPAMAVSQVNDAHRRWRESSAPASPQASAPSLALIPASHGLESGVREEFRKSLGLLAGICACLWVITIVNVSGLLTARLSERSREIALRQALGATSSRLFVQLLTEVIVLVAGGVILGLTITVALSSVIPTAVPSWAGIDLHVSPLVFAATALTALLAALAVTFVQAVSIDRRSLTSQLAPSLLQFGSGRRFRLSTCLVGAQLALTLPLMVVAGLLAQSLYRLGHVDTGFERSNLLQISVEPALVGYSGERARSYYGALTERLRAVPGVADASVSSGGALSGYDGIARLRIGNNSRDVTTNAVDDRYFSTMGIRLAAGRSFSRAEARGNAPVIVVNDALARRLFDPIEGAIGHVVTVDLGRTGEQRTVIGVVENTADASLRDRSTPTAYLPVADSSLLVVHVRLLDGAVGIPADVRRAATSVDANVPILRIDTIEGLRHNALQRERLLGTTSLTIGWVALALSAIGLFGRVTREVVVRTREIVIRSALGATRCQIANLFVRDTARILLLSSVPGIGAAIAAARFMRGQMFGVSGTDLTVYVAAAAVLGVVATVATLLPLRRASKAGESTHLLRV